MTSAAPAPRRPRIARASLALLATAGLAGCPGGGGGGGTTEPVPVASVSVEPAAATVLQGGTRQLGATLKDAGGNPLTGRAVDWTSADPSVASVSATGLVTAVAVGGPVAVTVTAGGRSGSSLITVQARTAARIEVAPRFTTVAVGAAVPLQVMAFDAAGVAIPSPAVTWAAATPERATVSAGGAVSGVAAGLAGFRARVDAALDSAWVAVLGPTSLLSTAFVGGNIRATVEPGQTVAVPVTLDLSQVATDGDLGSAQLDLLYDRAILEYVSAEVGVTGSASYHVPTPGTFKFGFAATAPQGAASLTLVTVTFRVAASAPALSTLTLTYTASPTSTGFAAYGAPLAVGARLMIAVP